jgi:hypothetical protein
MPCIILPSLPPGYLRAAPDQNCIYQTNHAGQSARCHKEFSNPLCRVLLYGFTNFCSSVGPAKNDYGWSLVSEPVVFRVSSSYGMMCFVLQCVLLHFLLGRDCTSFHFHNLLQPVTTPRLISLHAPQSRVKAHRAVFLPADHHCEMIPF